MVGHVAQEGGNHYQAEYQHWDWIIDIHMGYLEGNATKYISRWRKKNGIEDLRKAVTYLEKASKANRMARYSNQCHAHHGLVYLNNTTDRFITANELGREEAEIIHAIMSWRHNSDLSIAIGLIRGLITRSEMVQEDAAGQPATTLSRPRARATADPLRTAPDASEPGRINHPRPFGYDPNGDQQ